MVKPCRTSVGLWGCGIMVPWNRPACRCPGRSLPSCVRRPQPQRASASVASPRGSASAPEPVLALVPESRMAGQLQPPRAALCQQLASAGVRKLWPRSGQAGVHLMPQGSLWNQAGAVLGGCPAIALCLTSSPSLFCFLLPHQFLRGAPLS